VKHFYTSTKGVRHSWERGDDGKIRIQSSQDAEPFLDTAKAMNTHNDGYSPSRELRRVALIPPIVEVLWMNQYGVNPLMPEHHDLLCRLLNSSEWSYLRTAPGQISANSGSMI
jgi:hypothetical protein